MADPPRTVVTRPFARFISESKREGDSLVLTRTLEILAPVVSAAAAGDAKTLWSQIQGDQDRSFNLVRVGPVDWRAYAAGTQPYQMISTGSKLYANGDMEGALAIYERGVEAKQPSAEYLKGAVLWALGREDESNQLHERLVQEGTKAYGPYDFLAGSANRRGHPEKAAEVFRSWLKLNPGDARIREAMVRALLEAGKVTEAEEAMNGLSLPPPQDRSVRIDSILVRTCQGRGSPVDLNAERPSPYDFAIASSYLLACNADPALIEPLIERGLELQRPFHDLRTNDHRSVYAAQFSRARLLAQRGRLRLRLGQRESAVADLRASVALMQTPDALVRLARTLWEAGSRAEAAQYWSDAIASGALAKESVPAEAHTALPPSPMADLDWYPVIKLPANPLPPGESARYYSIRANEDGTVDRIRDMNPEPTLVPLLGVIRGLILPAVLVDGQPVPSAHFLRLVVDREGVATIYRSNSETTFTRMQVLFRASFPVVGQAQR